MKMKQDLYLWLLLLLCMSGCCCPRYRSCPPCCIESRRPQVMCSWESCVWDYDPDFDDEEAAYADEVSDEHCCEQEKRAPLTPDMFNRFVPMTKEYHLSVGDILQISVYGDEETTIENVIVAPDGRIYYTLVEGILAEGRTLTEVRDELIEKLSHFFISPVVTVIPTFQADQTYKILGRVSAPGLYPLMGSMRLRDAIGQAGGIVIQQENDSNNNDIYSNQSTANLRDSFVVRDGKKLNVNFENLFKSPSNDQNIFILPGDYIYIAPQNIQEVYVLGNVASSRAVPWTFDLTLMGAIADAGGLFIGYPYSPDITNILVLRGPLDCPCAIHIDMCKIVKGQARDLHLLPGDIVFVPNKTMRFGRAMIRLAINVFVQSFGSAAGQYWGQQWFPIPTLDAD
jgi:protein involved in polysaccharide export with SLBB domain